MEDGTTRDGITNQAGGWSDPILRLTIESSDRENETPMKNDNTTRQAEIEARARWDAAKETPSSGSERRLVMLDDDGDEVTDRDEIVFSYGIPPVRVCAQVEDFEGELWALTPGHNPSRCRLSEIREYVGCFYKA